MSATVAEREARKQKETRVKELCAGLWALLLTVCSFGAGWVPAGITFAGMTAWLFGLAVRFRFRLYSTGLTLSWG